MTLSHARWSIRSSVGAKGEAAWKEGTKAGVEGNEEEEEGGEKEGAEGARRR